MLITAIALFTTACAAASTTGSDQASGDDPTTTASGGTGATTTADSPPAAQGTLPDGPSALDDMANDAFPDPLVPLGEIISGGPPPDGIPPIDDPVFLPVVDNLQILDPAEPVVVLEINGDARAYPIRAMVWHEIVNDTVGGVPVSVTYCPLCNSAVTYVREINGVETTFEIGRASCRERV